MKIERIRYVKLPIKETKHSEAIRVLEFHMGQQEIAS